MSNDSERNHIWHADIKRRILLQRVLTGAAVLPGLDLLTRGSGVLAYAHARATLPSKATGTLRVANPGEPNFIDPADALEITEFGPIRNVYGGLVNWDPTYTKLIPDLATSWKSNPDATEWTFMLRSGVTFHDGTPFDSTAARKTIEYYKGKTWGLVWANLVKIDDSNPQVLRVFFSKPAPDLARDQSLVRMISPKLIAAKAVAKQMVGTGPYRFKAWNKGQSIILEANPSYWDKGHPFIQEIQFLTIADKTAAVNALKAGDVDVIMKVDPKQLQALAKDPRFGVASNRSWLQGWLFFKWNLTPTNDVRVRQAIAYAVDLPTITKEVMLGQAKPAPSPLPYGTYGWVNPPTRYPYNPTKARALLKAAGYGSGLSLKMGSQAGVLILGDEVSQAVVGQLSEVGINVKLDIMEPGLLATEIASNHATHHLFHAEFGWVDGSEFHFTVGNALSYTSATTKQLQKIQAIVDKTTTTPDGSQRLQYLAALQNEFMQELPYLPMYDATLSDVFQANIKGYSNPRDGYLPYFGNAYRV